MTAVCHRLRLTVFLLSTQQLRGSRLRSSDLASMDVACACVTEWQPTIPCGDLGDEETCGAQGDCSWDGSSCLQAESNVGAIAGGAVGGAVGLALLLLIIACACKKKKPKAQMPTPRANSVVVQGVPMGTVPTGTAV